MDTWWLTVLDALLYLPVLNFTSIINRDYGFIDMVV
jgi:hypothetical protein